MSVNSATPRRSTATLRHRPSPPNEHANLDGKEKVDFVKELHASVQANIERKNEQYAKQANKGHLKVVFQPRDWVWVLI